MKRSTISVCVVSYLPVKEKIIKTLDSILMQEDIDLQVVISDDGSGDNLFDFIRAYFKKYNFVNYKLVAFKENQGTTMNMLHGLEVCNGNYIKSLSPGDSLIGKKCLSEWIKNLKISGKRWSFGRAVCYTPLVNGGINVCSKVEYPQITECYSANEDKQCRWNYVALGDRCIGATTIFETELLVAYLKKLEGKVIYAEDLSCRLMMFDGIVGNYYANPVVLYEFGNGISTSGNQLWKERIYDDWMRADEIMFADKTKMDKFQQMLMKACLLSNSTIRSSNIRKLLTGIRIKGWLNLQLKRHIYPKMTPKDFKVE